MTSQIVRTLCLDSDSTWPAIDDFGSRFLEIDDYLQVPFNDDADSYSFLSKSGNHSSSSSGACAFAGSLNRRRKVKRIKTFNRQLKKSNCNGELIPNDDSLTVVEDDNNSFTDDEIDDELLTFRNPKLLTARQLSLQSQRNNTTDGPSTSGPNENVYLELSRVTKPTIPLTKEQIAIRQKRIARRRESAKHKFEMEKQMTVERLLKVNNSEGSGKRIRGKGRRYGGVTRHSFKTHLTSGVENPNEDRRTSSSLVDESNSNECGEFHENDELSKPDQMISTQNSSFNLLNQKIKVPRPDPLPGYIRSISSIRLTPNCAICLPKDWNDHVNGQLKCLSLNQSLPSPPKPNYCEMGCGRLRRYVCSKSGRSLCSLNCYKQNLTNLPNSAMIVT